MNTCKGCKAEQSLNTILRVNGIFIQTRELANMSGEDNINEKLCQQKAKAETKICTRAGGQVEYDGN